jgi:hypothetical protein
MSNNKQKREYKTLLQVLANGNPGGASDLLKKYSGETAQNTQDLAIKLERAYVLAPYKKDIEKDFASIHPHRDFILKYTEPKVIIKEVKAVETEPVVVKLPEPTPQIAITEQISGANGMGMVWGRGGHPPCANPNCPRCSQYFSKASGDDNCPGMSNACGCGCNKFSNASGESQPNQNNNSNNSVVIFGIVSLVAIFGMVLILKKDK